MLELSAGFLMADEIFNVCHINSGITKSSFHNKVIYVALKPKQVCIPRLFVPIFCNRFLLKNRVAIKSVLEVNLL